MIMLIWVLVENMMMMIIVDNPWFTSYTHKNMLLRVQTTQTIQDKGWQHGHVSVMFKGYTKRNPIQYIQKRLTQMAYKYVKR